MSVPSSSTIMSNILSMAYMSAGLGCRYKLCGDNIWARPPDPGPRPGNPLRLSSQHRRVTNTRVWFLAVKIQLQVLTNTCPRMNCHIQYLDHTQFGKLVCEVGIKSRCHFVTTSHVTTSQVIAAVMPDVLCSGVVDDFSSQSSSHSSAQKCFSHINMPE